MTTLTVSFCQTRAGTSDGRRLRFVPRADHNCGHCAIKAECYGSRIFGARRCTPGTRPDGNWGHWEREAE